jgi:antirestriction protein ArdC
VRAFQVITDRIVSLIERDGILPWKRPWRTDSPRNIRGTAYRGVNRLILSVQSYSDPRWLTFKQIGELGGVVRGSERGTPVLFWSQLEHEQEGELHKRFVARSYYVFNVEQAEGLKIDSLVNSVDKSQSSTVEGLALSMRPEVKVERKGTTAYYSPLQDTVVIPQVERFYSIEEYEQTLAHELIHASGHPSRLARKEVSDPIKFGLDKYAREELVAELGASFLTANLGIASNIEQSASYVAGWLKALRNDKSLIIQAASSAQAAVDFILAPIEVAAHA